MARKPKNKKDDDNEELESYLTDKFNVEIYDGLTEGANAGLFEPLAFFKLLYAQYEIVQANKEKPLTVIKSFSTLNITDHQKWYLLDKLAEFIEDENNTGYYFAEDEQLDICRTRIEKERDRVAEALPLEQRAKRQPARERQFDFEGKVKPFLETLLDRKARIEYLYEVKTEYEQTFSNDPNFSWPTSEPSFGEKCELEIQKLKQQMALERKPQAESRTETEAAKHNPEFTTARQVLAVHYLLQYVKVQNVNKTEIARFIEFLTGKSYDSIYKKVREPLKLKDSEAEKDLEFVKAYFVKLGLSEIVRMIDNEIAQSS